MSKTADRNKSTNNSNSSTKKPVQQPKPKAQVEPKQEVQSQPVQGEVVTQPSSSDLLGRQVASLYKDLKQIDAKYTTCAKATILLGGIVKKQQAVLEDHQTAINSLGQRLSVVEEKTGICQQTSIPQAEAPAQLAETCGEPAEHSATDTVARSVPCKGFTGKADVFYIHDQNGDVDMTMPFFRRARAKQFDPKYVVVSSWIENGKVIRPLEAHECAGGWW